MSEYQTLIPCSFASAPDIAFTISLGCEEILACLISSFLYNLVLHRNKSSDSDFIKYKRKVDAIFNKSIDTSEIIKTIINYYETTNINLQSEISACFWYIKNYSLPSSNITLSKIMSRLNFGNSLREKCQNFANTFDVIVKIISNNKDTAEFHPSPLTRHMILRIVERENIFSLCFTKELDWVGKYGKFDTYDQFFESSPYFYSAPLTSINSKASLIQSDPEDDEVFEINPKNINRITRVSKRYPISFFPVADEIKTELELEYSSCVTISENQNQIRAFSYQLHRYLSLFSSNEYCRGLINSFSQRKTMCELNLSSGENLSRSSLLELFEICIRVFDTAVQTASVFEDLMPFQKNEDLDCDFKTIHVLSRIFGVTSTVIYEESKKYKRKVVNCSTEGFYPDFHFYGMSKEANRKKVYVMFTKKADYVERFDFGSQKSSKIQIKITDQMNLKSSSSKIQENNSNPNHDANFTYFLSCLADVQNSVIKSFVDHFKYSDPIYPIEMIDEKIMQMKEMNKNYKTTQITSLNLENLEILKIRSNNIVTICHQCRCPADKSIKSYFSQNGCFFHFDCVKKLLENVYKSDSFQFENIHDFDIICPSCPNKEISIISYLKHPDNAYNLKTLKFFIEKKIACCYCKKNISMQPTNDIDIENFHCQECLARVYIYQFCKECKKERENFIESDEMLVTCSNCNQQCCVGNFRIDSNSDRVMCLKCWIECLRQYVNQGYDEQTISAFIYLFEQKNYIYCEICTKPRPKTFSYKFCNSCASQQICCLCSNSDKCQNCGSVYNVNPYGLWK